MSSWLDKISNLFNFNNKNPECENRKSEAKKEFYKKIEAEKKNFDEKIANIEKTCNPKGQQAEQDPVMQDPARAQVMQDPAQRAQVMQDPARAPVAPVVQDSAEDSVQQRPAEKIGGGKRKKSKKQRRSKRKNTKRNR